MILSALITRIGSPLPASIAPTEHIKKVGQRLKNAPPKLALDLRDAGGLPGDITRP